MNRNPGESLARHRRTSLLRLPALSLGLAPFFYAAGAHAATVTLPPVSLGAGARASFTNTNIQGSSDDDTNDATLDSVRLYLTGNATENIKLTVNTEYNSTTDDLIVMDAIARFEFQPEFNIWAGRFLPPSDRANLYGPYYANNFGVYVDGIQDGWVNTAVGRDNGIAYWGDFSRLKVSAGVFDVPSTTGDHNKADSPNGKNVIAAGRLQYDFWDLESGYFLNGTYYGEKDLLAVGVAGQALDGDNGWSVDFLLEKNFPGAGALSVESEYADYEQKVGGYTGTAAPAFDEDKGYYGLASWLFPAQVGIGKFQVLGKYGEAKYSVDAAPDFKQKTAEFDLNYLIKTFNARISLFYIDESLDQGIPDLTKIGIGLQVQI